MNDGGYKPILDKDGINYLTKNHDYWDRKPKRENIFKKIIDLLFK